MLRVVGIIASLPILERYTHAAAKVIYKSFPAGSTAGEAKKMLSFFTLFDLPDVYLRVRVFRVFMEAGIHFYFFCPTHTANNQRRCACLFLCLPSCLFPSLSFYARLVRFISEGRGGSVPYVFFWR